MKLLTKSNGNLSRTPEEIEQMINNASEAIDEETLGKIVFDIAVERAKEELEYNRADYKRRIKIKEKAKELYLKYTNALNIRDLQATANPFAKQCALIAVDEIINTNPKITINWAFSGIQEFDNINHWQEVKQEIEKL
jgi:hypothetical protein